MTQPDIQNPVSTDTSVPEEQTAPVVTDGNAEVESNEVASSSADVETQKTELAQRREEGKLKQVQEEAKKTREENEAYKKQIELLANVVAEDKTIYRKALQKQGYSLEDANKLIADIERENPNQWISVDNPEIMDIVNQHPVIQEAQQYLNKQKQSEIERENAVVMKFEADKPDITSNPIYSVDIARQIVGTQANFLGLRPENKGKSREELWQLGYEASRAILNPEGIQKTIENAELNGMLKANIDNASSHGVPSSGRTDNQSSVHLNELEARMAKQANMSPEEYLKWKR